MTSAVPSAEGAGKPTSQPPAASASRSIRASDLALRTQGQQLKRREVGRAGACTPVGFSVSVTQSPAGARARARSRPSRHRAAGRWRAAPAGAAGPRRRLSVWSSTVRGPTPTGVVEARTRRGPARVRLADALGPDDPVGVAVGVGEHAPDGFGSSGDEASLRGHGHGLPTPPWHDPTMAKYSVNDRAVDHALELIAKRQYVLDSNWGEAQPRAADENAYLENHSWEEYAAWHLGLTEGAKDGTKARYAFVLGDFRRIHRMGISPATTAPPSGATRRSSWRPTTFCRRWTTRSGRPVLARSRRAPAARVAAHERASGVARRGVGVPAGRRPRGASCRCRRTGSCTGTARPPTRTSPTRSRSTRRSSPTRTRPASTGGSSRCPTGWPEGDAVLRFGGADSHLRAWLNGVELGEACGSRLAHEFAVGAPAPRREPARRARAAVVRGHLPRGPGHVVAVRAVPRRRAPRPAGRVRRRRVRARRRRRHAARRRRRARRGWWCPSWGSSAPRARRSPPARSSRGAPSCPGSTTASCARRGRPCRCGSASAPSRSRTASCASTGGACCCAASTATSGTPTMAAP